MRPEAEVVATEAAEVSRLEQAELAARARRLAAEAEADRLIETAREEARRIEAESDAQVANALAELRRRYLEQAESEVAAIEAELAGRAGQREAAAATGPAFEAAVELVVAAVLGETGR
jgi:vacuolar-type H+-ATPase subunit H